MTEIKNVKTVADNLSKYDYLCNANDNPSISITEWENKEGWIINLYKGNNDALISLSRGELDAINYLTQKLEYES